MKNVGRFKVLKFNSFKDEDGNWDWRDYVDTGEIVQLEIDSVGRIIDEQELWNQIKYNLIEDEDGMLDWHVDQMMGYVTMYVVSSWDDEPLLRLERIWD